MSSAPEVWLRGPVEGYDPLVMPVVHALLQVHEDLGALAAAVPAAHVWHRVGDAATLGFHVRHLGGSLDRLLTYARGEALDEAQKAALRVEKDPGNPPDTLDGLVARTQAAIDRALIQVRGVTADRVLAARAVGRAQLPTTVLGLLVHAAEHSTRHAGQALTTARLLANLELAATPPRT